MTIGILAGMGVRSTSPFVELVIDRCQQQHGIIYDGDYPPMMIYSLPSPFKAGQPLDHQSMKQTIMDGLRRLVACKVDYVVIPCNTAHLYFEELEECCEVPLFNMVDLAVDSLVPHMKKIAVFATQPTLDGNLYQKRLSAFGKSHLEEAYSPQKFAELLTLIKQGTQPEKAQALWRDMLNDAVRLGADGAILACTDLNAVNQPDSPLPLLDATEILANHTADYYYQTKKA